MDTRTEIFTTILNVVLHVLILWTFLTFFFFLFASKLSVDALQNEIGHYIEKGVSGSLNSLQPEEKEKAKKLISAFPLDNLINANSGMDPNVETNNKWVHVISIMVIFGLALLFITIASLLKAGCDPNVSLKHIFTENFFTFLFVGIIEYLFFKYVAIKYIPVQPSVITNTLIDRLKYNFSQ